MCSGELYSSVLTVILFLVSMFSCLGAVHLRGQEPGHAPAVGFNQTFVLPLSSGGWFYTTSFGIGTPTKAFRFIVDTGSDLVWLPCKRSSQKPGDIFDPEKSSSYRNLSCSSSFCTPSSSCKETCQYQYDYSDKSNSVGYMATETLTLVTKAGKKRAVQEFVVGCAFEYNGTFTGSDGVVGLGKGPLSFTSQLGKYFDYKFSYCLVSFHDGVSKISQLVFGKVSPPPSTKFQYTRLLENTADPSSYYMAIEGIAVNDVDLNIPSRAFHIDRSAGGGMAIDSGATFSYLVPEVYSRLCHKATGFMSKYGYSRADGTSVGLEFCWDLSGIPEPKFPTVVFRFSGMNLTLATKNTFVQADGESSTCLAFAKSDFGFSIFGNRQQQNFIVEYDLAKSRIGFAPAECDRLQF